MTKNNTLIDSIELKDGRNLLGIADFISNKQIYFFDFTQEPNVDYLLLAILWKGYSPDIRFSVFCAIYYPDLTLPRAKFFDEDLIPTINIKSSSKNFTPTKKSKQRKKMSR